MKTYCRYAALVILFVSAACASRVAQSESSAARQELRIASSFMNSIIAEDYRNAYALFSTTVTSQYPYGLFATMQKQINDRLGLPVAYSFERESSPDPAAGRMTENPARTYVYSMRFKKRAETSDVPVLITVEHDSSPARLLSYRFLMNEIN